MDCSDEESDDKSGDNSSDGSSTFNMDEEVYIGYNLYQLSNICFLHRRYTKKKPLKVLVIWRHR